MNGKTIHVVQRAPPPPGMHNPDGRPAAAAAAEGGAREHDTRSAGSRISGPNSFMIQLPDQNHVQVCTKNMI